MPNIRAVTMPDETWESVKAVAARQGLSAAAWVRRTVMEELRRSGAPAAPPSYEELKARKDEAYKAMCEARVAQLGEDEVAKRAAAYRRALKLCQQAERDGLDRLLG